MFTLFNNPRYGFEVSETKSQQSATFEKVHHIIRCIKSYKAKNVIKVPKLASQNYITFVKCSIKSSAMKFRKAVIIFL